MWEKYKKLQKDHDGCTEEKYTLMETNKKLSTHLGNNELELKQHKVYQSELKKKIEDLE